jgi:hypothetical protein
MAANAFDAEIRKYLSLLGNEEKKSLLNIIKNFFNATPKGKENKKPKATSLDYSKFHFPVSDIKYNRDEINER